MLKRFLNDESKSPIKDFLLWLVVYPFVIAFAVACAAFIFSFSVFRDVKFTDWVSSLSTFIIMFLTAIGVSSWKKQKIPDLKSKVARNIIDFDTHAVLLPSRNFKSIDEIREYNIIQLKIYWDIEHSLSTLYMFDTLNENKQEIDIIFNNLLEVINGTTDLIKNRGNKLGIDQLVELINANYKSIFQKQKIYSI
ncbi:hypothetical protein [Rodentibacter pneumotropicus]|uniref:hypothetical protein n=1 Tax=Rodentibacter pneumotropicus TaxID=758 RepID=UPI000367E0F6|nr:hypothetical protein [Rodentibacter pneumotropicus]